MPRWSFDDTNLGTQCGKSISKNSPNTPFCSGRGLASCYIASEKIDLQYSTNISRILSCLLKFLASTKASTLMIIEAPLPAPATRVYPLLSPQSPGLPLVARPTPVSHSWWSKVSREDRRAWESPAGTWIINHLIFIKWSWGRRLGLKRRFPEPKLGLRRLNQSEWAKIHTEP